MMKKLILFLMMFLAISIQAQNVTRPGRNIQAVINNLYNTNVFMRNTNLLPAYVPRMTDTVYSPYNCPPSMLSDLLGTPISNVGKTLQVYDAGFSTFFAYSDGINWIISAVAYNTLTDYGIYFQDSIYHDWGTEDWPAENANWPGDSIPDGTDTGYITIYVNNYTEGIGIPINIYELYATDLTDDTEFERGWLEIDGEEVFWYDWERVLSDDTTTFEVVVDKSKIPFGADPAALGIIEFNYPRGGPSYPAGQSAPYAGKSYAIKVVKDIPH